MGFGIWDLGFEIWGLGSGSGIWDLGPGIWDLGFKIWGLGVGIRGLGFEIWGLGDSRLRMGPTCRPIPGDRGGTLSPHLNPGDITWAGNGIWKSPEFPTPLRPPWSLPNLSLDLFPPLVPKLPKFPSLPSMGSGGDIPVPPPVPVPSLATGFGNWELSRISIPPGYTNSSIPRGGNPGIPGGSREVWSPTGFGIWGFPPQIPLFIQYSQKIKEFPAKFSINFRSLSP